MNSPESPRRWTNVPGRLFAEESGRHTGDPRIYIHGFTQTSRSWDPLLTSTKSNGPVRRIDLPGHALSSNVIADLPMTAALIAEQCGIGDYIGYSLGGRVALHVALNHPDVVKRLILISATAGLDNAVDRQTRIQNDEVLAERAEDSFIGDFIDFWRSNEMFAGLTKTDADFEDRCRNTGHGLATSLRSSGTGTQQPLWSRLHLLSMPILIIAGHNDHKFATLAKRMAEGIGINARLEIVADCGHSVHLENSAVVAKLIENFCNG